MAAGAKGTDDAIAETGEAAADEIGVTADGVDDGLTIGLAFTPLTTFNVAVARVDCLGARRAVSGRTGPPRGTNGDG